MIDWPRAIALGTVFGFLIGAFLGFLKWRQHVLEVYRSVDWREDLEVDYV